MTNKIILRSGAALIEIPKPRYGYVSEISMPLTFCRHRGSAYGVFDSGAAYDTRACTGVEFDMSEADMTAFAAFLETSAQGRGETITLRLETNSGFFPFGPDLGDSGDFTVRILRFVPGGQQHAPWKYWRPTIDMQWISGPAPAYGIVDNMADGTVQLGAVTGLRYPQSGYDVAVRYAEQTIVTLGSDAYAVDNGAGGDEYESEFEFTGNQGKMAALVHELITNVRGGTATYIAPANNYPFGRDKASSGSFTVQMLYSARESNSAILSIQHERFDNFSFKTNMRFVS